MPSLGVEYDPNHFDPEQRPDPVPAGVYGFMILKTDVKPTRNGNGSFLWIEHEISDGEFKGRKFWNQITLDNPSIQAVEIGQKQLSALCHCVGYLKPMQDSDVLHGRTGQAELSLDPEQKEVDKTTGRETGKIYPAKNSVRKYIFGEAQKAKAGAPKADQTQASSPAGGRAKKPWEK